jgi:hypothetical protein
VHFFAFFYVFNKEDFLCAFFFGGKGIVCERRVAICVFITAVPIIKMFAWTREEPGTLTQGGALFSLVPLVWESNLMMMPFNC